jgi:ankyrin repeat protein
MQNVQENETRIKLIEIFQKLDQALEAAKRFNDEADKDPIIHPELLPQSIPEPVKFKPIPIMRPPIKKFTPPPIVMHPPEMHCKICNNLMKRRPYGGVTSLHIAAMSGDNGDIATIQMLLDHSNNQWINVVDNQNKTPLHYACALGQITVVKLLLEKGADPNIIDCTNYQTPLHIATYRNYLPMINLLLKYNANVLIPDYLWRTPLHIALERKHKAAILKLYKLYNNMDMQDGFGESFIEKAEKVDAGLAVILEAYKALIGAHNSYKNQNCGLSTKSTHPTDTPHLQR